MNPFGEKLAIECGQIFSIDNSKPNNSIHTFYYTLKLAFISNRFLKSNYTIANGSIYLNFCRYRIYPKISELLYIIQDKFAQFSPFESREMISQIFQCPQLDSYLGKLFFQFTIKCVIVGDQ